MQPAKVSHSPTDELRESGRDLGTTKKGENATNRPVRPGAAARFHGLLARVFYTFFFQPLTHVWTSSLRIPRKFQKLEQAVITRCMWALLLVAGRSPCSH